MKKKLVWDEMLGVWKSNLIVVVVAMVLSILNIFVLKNNPVITGLVFGINIAVLSNLLARNIVNLHNDLIWDRMIKKLEKIGK